MDADKNERREPLGSVEEIYNHAEELRETVCANRRDDGGQRIRLEAPPSEARVPPISRPSTSVCRARHAAGAHRIWA